MIHICHITSVHKQSDTRIFWKECRSAASAGFRCTLLVLNGDDESLEGVQITGVKIPIGSRLARIFKGGNAMLDKAIDLKADIYHLHDPELLRIALKLKRLTGAKVVYDSHEDLPKQVMDKHWIPKPFRMLVSRFVAFFEKRVTSKIDGVISVTDIICDRFKGYNSNVVKIANYPILEEIERYKDPSAIRKTNQICYVGGLFPTRGIKELVKSLEYCNAELILAGSFSSKEFENEVKQLKGWEKVKFLGFVDRKEIIHILETSRIGIVTLHPTPSYLEAMPIKLFEYMSAGLPVIASNFPNWNQYVLDNHCGIMVDPLEPKALAEAIDRLLTNIELSKSMGENGMKAVQEKYSWSSQASVLSQFYTELCK